MVSKLNQGEVEGKVRRGAGLNSSSTQVPQNQSTWTLTQSVTHQLGRFTSNHTVRLVSTALPVTVDWQQFIVDVNHCSQATLTTVHMYSTAISKFYNPWPCAYAYTGPIPKATCCRKPEGQESLPYGHWQSR